MAIHSIASSKLKFSFENLEKRRVLTAATFAPHTLVETDHLSIAFPADVDSDGDVDIVWSSYHDGRLGWYENTDGKGTFDARHQVDTGNFRGVRATDIDSDGDLDFAAILYSIEADDENTDEESNVVWFENLNGRGRFGERQTTSVNASYIDSWAFDDFDGDGDPDLLVSGEGSLSSHTNIGGSGMFVVAEIVDGKRAWDIAVADADGDGDLDIFASGNNRVVLYKNTDGVGSFGAPRLIDDRHTDSLFVDDLDGDGDFDLATDSGWHENSDGRGNFESRSFLQPWWEYDYTFADLDNDNDFDALKHEHGMVSWEENTGEFGEFRTANAISNQAGPYPSTFTADLDSDGDLDVVVKSWDSGQLTWFRNTDGRGTFSQERYIRPSANGARSVHVNDLDGDGDEDVVSVSFDDGRIAWYENTDSAGTFGEQETISVQHGAYSARIADIDDDGDLDVVAASFLQDAQRVNVVWFENVDGRGQYGDAQAIASIHAGWTYETSIEMADIDADGDIDLMAFGQDGLSWFENTDGNGTFGIGTQIAEGSRTYMQVVDIDGDGDFDTLTVIGGGQFVLHENVDGKGRFVTRTVNLPTEEHRVQSAEAIDLDGDGDLDLLAVIDGDGERCHERGCQWRGTELVWYENSGLFEFETKRVLAVEPRVFAGHNRHRIRATDFDGDGDLDVLAFSSVGSSRFRRESDDAIVWFENLDGQENFAAPQFIADEVFGLRAIKVADIDGDHDLDVITASSLDGKIAWFERTSQNCGDSNRDGIFDSADLIAVFQAGEYEDDHINNSTFEQGDWNGDGEFDSSDLVAAFQSGNYQL